MMPAQPTPSVPSVEHTSVEYPAAEALESTHTICTPVTEADRQAIKQQLGREPRGLVGVAASCMCGAPQVALTAPRLPDGTPFPTIYYLTHPGLTAAISRLEADGAMREFNQQLADDAEFASAYTRAHEAYLADRQKLAEQLQLTTPEIAGVSAGGMPNRVKCLHALVAHSLAAGPGVNPVGDAVLRQITSKCDHFACFGTPAIR